MVRPRGCCIVNCKNSTINSQCQFYSFPTAKCKIDQRNKWCTIVKLINFSSDGSAWIPKPHHLICSAHFIGNQKSNNPSNPNYVPTIFPPISKGKVNKAINIKRHARLIDWRVDRPPESTTVNQEQPPIETVMIKIEEGTMNSEIDTDESLKYADKGCQAEIFFNCFQPHKTFTCNRYIGDIYSDVEIQTDIAEYKGPINIKFKDKECSIIQKFKDKKCGTSPKTYEDKAVGPGIEDEDETTPYFNGFLSVKRNQELLDLAGITFNNFNILLNQLTKSPAKQCKISKEDRLLIVLIKIKSGMTFFALGALFSVDRVTISRIFFSTLQELSSATANFIFWPDQNVIRQTIPQCFYPDYNDTRVMIYCTEFEIGVPVSVHNRKNIISHCKKGITAKILIGVTPGGLISFKSKVTGGRMSDYQIIIESGLLDLLEDGDKVLSDKNYPQIQQSMNATGKNLLLVTIPDLNYEEQFDKQGIKETCSETEICMYMEKYKQYLRTFNILNKITTNLSHYIDDILHMCCVLINLQPPVIYANDETNEDDK